MNTRWPRSRDAGVLNVLYPPGESRFIRVQVMSAIAHSAGRSCWTLKMSTTSTWEHRWVLLWIAWLPQEPGHCHCSRHSDA